MAKFLSAIALLVVLSITIAAQWTVKLPQPTGPYQIGTTNFALVDEARPEAFTDDPKDHRELLVRCWYPGQSVAGARSGSVPFLYGRPALKFEVSLPCTRFLAWLYSGLSLPKHRADGGVSQSWVCRI